MLSLFLPCGFELGCSAKLATMELLPVAHEMLEHNYWARDRQLQACATLSEEQFLRPFAGSFTSLRDTLVHLVATEWLWLERWRGKSPKTLISPQELPSLTAIEERWRIVEREMRAYFDSLNEDKLASPTTFISTRGQVWNHPLWVSIIHCLNHQNYHRGQVTNYLRALGLQPPTVDFLIGKDMNFQL